MSALRQELFVFGALALAFVVFSLLVAGGGMSQVDHEIARDLGDWWQPSLKPVFIGVAFLGGIELTTLAALGLGIFLVYRRLVDEALAVIAFPAAVILEFIYKRVVAHPGPPVGFSHGDAPSLSGLVEGPAVAGASSFPSGHVTRALVIYGLIAFVTWRLAGRGWVRRIAIPVAMIIVVAEAFDRLYLGVHWESDVVGALLLGGTCLAAGILWLDRPRRVA